MEWVLLGHVPQPRPRASLRPPRQAGPGTKPDQSGGGWGVRRRDGVAASTEKHVGCALPRVAREPADLQ